MERLKDLAGVELDPVSWKEHAASVVGGLLGMTLVAVVTTQALGLTGAAALVGSIAASAVLVFAAPLAAFSQPWPVVGGHLISAVVGLACASLLGRTPYTAALAVALAIGAMSLCRCIHPPGGATAFVAVAGGPAVAALGWSFLWHPVLVDVAVLLVVAVVFNNVVPWRRYPAALGRPALTGASAITHEQVVAALRELDSFVDLPETEIVRLVELLRADP